MASANSSGNDLLYVIPKTLLADLFPVFVEVGIGKSGLAHQENRCQK